MAQANVTSPATAASAPPPGFVQPRRGLTLPRDRTPLGLWFWEIDRLLLLLFSVLIAVGLVAVAAASPEMDFVSFCPFVSSP